MVGLLGIYIQYAKRDIVKKGIGNTGMLKVRTLYPSFRCGVVVKLDTLESPENEVTLHLFPWLESWRSGKDESVTFR